MHIAILPLIAGLIVIGVLLWALSQFPAIDATIKKIIFVVAVVCAVFWVMSCIGLLNIGVRLT